jgi:hypothetical protein
MAGLRFTELQSRPIEFLDFTRASIMAPATLEICWPGKGAPSV